MNALRIAIRQFWGELENIQGIPFSQLLVSPTNPFGAVFPSGYADIQDMQGRITAAPFPYITYDIFSQSFQSQSLIMGRVWNSMPNNPGHFGLVDHVLGQFKSRFKGGAVTLNMIDGSGGVILRFDRIMTMPRDTSNPLERDITSGIMQMVIKDFTL